MSSQESIQDPPFQLGTSSPILSYFCVYNPSLSSSEENTKDQILYYTSKKVVPVDVKMKHVGLAQALVNFSATFPISHPVQNVHSQKHRMVFLQPEPGFWMHMCIELGVLRKQIKDSKGKEKLVTEYLDSQLNNRALEAVLKIGYEQFKLLNGSFSSILSGEPSRQRARALTHAIEEFFSDWIWKWDFDRLDIMCFNAVFNGVPVQSVQRNHYLKANELDTYIKKQFDSLISHVFVLDSTDGSLIYRSPTLSIMDVRSLRKCSMRMVEKQVNAEKRKTGIEQAFAKKEAKNQTMAGLKSITKTLSQNHFLSYFSSGSKSTDSVASTTPTSTASQESVQNSTLPLPNTPTASSSIQSSLETEICQGMFLTGLVESTAIGMNGEERLVTKADLVRVYISSNEQSDKLMEYYLIIYKHKSNLVWNFLLPASEESEDTITDSLFYHDLQKYMAEKNLEQLTTTLIEDIDTMKGKNFDLGKHYKFFFYDNTTLNMKSTMTSSLKKSSTQITNEMLLQLLEIKDDFERASRSTNEVFTRSTSNYWIAGHRVYHTLLSESNKKRDNVQDYTEMYLIASKKDTSLAEIEETLGKMTSNLSEIMHIE